MINVDNFEISQAHIAVYSNSFVVDNFTVK